MYTFVSVFFSLVTVFMFLRMHHVHGSDTNTERIIILIGCVLFLLQAGFTYQQMLTDSYRSKRLITIANISSCFLFAVLFFWFVDFDSDSIFTVLLGT